MSRYPLRQPPAGWHVVRSLDEMTGSVGWYVVQHIGPGLMRTRAGPYTERWYAVQRAYELVAREAASKAE